MKSRAVLCCLALVVTLLGGIWGGSMAYAQEIAAGEYFWDSDPGFGFGTPISAQDGNFNEACEIAIANPATFPGAGVHSFNIRLQDTAATWGPTFSVVILLEDSLTPTPPEIVNGEYFWDFDPGLGMGSPLLAFDGNFNEAIESAMQNLNTYPGSGIHGLHVRLQDAQGNWGPNFSVVVSLEDTVVASISPVAAAEYFWDFDPGLGFGTPLLAQDGNFNEAIETAVQNLNTYPGSGVHTFNVRMRDAQLNWGPTFSVVITLEDMVTADFPNMVQAEYFWDFDPGAGSGMPLLAQDGNFDEAIETAVGNLSTYPGSGIHTFNLRFRDDDLNWGPVFSVVITLEDSLIADFPNIVQGEGYWDVDPGQGNGIPFAALDGNFDEALETAVNSSLQSFALSLGPHAFHTRLLDDDGNWGPTFGVVVWVDTSLVPVVQSVSGPTAFCESQNLNGIAYSTPNDPGTTYTWNISGGTLVSGQGTANVTVNWSGAGNHTLSVQGCDTAGCGNTFELNVVVDPNPVATITPSGPLTLCSGDTDTLRVPNAGTLGIQWMRNGTPISGATDSMLVVNTGGSYQVILTGVGSCADTSGAVGITVLPGLVVDAGTDQFLCSLMDTVTIGGSPAATGGTGTYTYAWTPAAGLTAANVERPGAVQPGTYTLSVSDGNGCTASDQVVVIQNPAIMVQPGQDTLICRGQTVMLGGFPTATGGAGGFTYAWTPAVGLSATNVANPLASPAVSTGYQVTATDQNGCAGIATVVVNLNPVINVNAGADRAICFGDSTFLGGSPTASGGSGGLNLSWTPGTGVSNVTAPNPSAMPLTQTDYVVTVTDGNNCSARDTVTIAVNTAQAVATGSTTICEGSSTPLTASGGTSYQWSPATGLSNANSATPVASPLTTTRYTVLVTDGAGCSDTASVLITVDPAVQAVVNNDTAACLGGSVQLSASGGTSYTWSPTTGLNNPNIASPLASPTTATRYTVTVSAGVCSDTASTLVEVNQVIAQVSNDTTVCLGNSATLLARGGDFYSWTPAATLSSPSVDNPTATPSVNTTYHVTVTDLIGCSDTGSVTVFIDPAITVSAGQDTTICEGTSAQLQATGGGTYSWLPAGSLNNPSIANPVATPLASTTYQVVVSAGACTDTASVTVTVDSVDAQATGGTAICVGGSVQLGALGGSSYSWSPTTGLNNPSIANPIATPGVTTRYTVTVSNGSCTDTASTLVTVNSATAQVTGDTSICAGESVQLQASGGVNYSWSPTTGLTNPSIANPVASPAASITYTVTVTNAQGCSDQETVTVTVNPPVTAQVSADTTICLGTTAALQASGGSSYSWSPATGLNNPNIANPTASPNVTTTYTVTVSTGACTDAASVTVTVDSVDAQATGGTAICVGGSVQLGASGGSSYSWSPTTGLNNPSIANPIATPGVTTRYTVTVSNGSCTDTASTLVTVNTATAQVSGDTSICAGGFAQLQASGGVNYSWLPTTGLNNPSIANPVASPTASITYTVTVTNAQGCTDQETVTITVDPAVIAQVSADTTICVGTTAALQASGGSSYSWSPATGLNNPNIANPTASPTVATTYTVTVSVGACSDVETVTVSLDSVEAVASGGTTICEGGTAVLIASGGPNVVWTPSIGLNDPNSLTPLASPVTTTTYLATVSNALGCEDTASTTVLVDPLPTALFGFSSVQATATFTNTTLDGVTYLWEFGDGNFSTVVNPVHTYQLPGTYNVCLIATNACGNDTLCLDVNVNFTGVEPVWSGTPPEVFPNPNRGEFTLRVPGVSGGASLSIRMQNALGVTVWETVEQNRQSGFEKQFAPDQLSSGVYFLEVQVGSDVWRRKVVIER